MKMCYVVGVSLRAPPKVLVDPASDLEAADEHLAAVAVESGLLLQGDGNLKQGLGRTVTILDAADFYWYPGQHFTTMAGFGGWR